MKFDEVGKKISAKFGDNIFFESTVPYLHKFLYDFISDKKSEHCLELGFAHGVSSCYLGAILDEIGRGCLLTIDRKLALEKTPNIYELINATGLGDFIEPIFTDVSYNWELMKIVEKNTVNNVCHPVFDFCFIDGGHTWETDGFAFFLVSKLLKKGGWLVFDDIYWTFSTSKSLKSSEFVRSMAKDYKATPQINKVFNLLAKQSKLFENFMINESFGIAWCQKIDNI